MSKAYVYILKCADGKYYTGVTTNLNRRLAEHRMKKYKGYTSYRLPVDLIFSKEFNTYHEAFQVERQIKKWSRAKKEALISNDLDQLHRLSECKNETHYLNKRK